MDATRPKSEAACFPPTGGRLACRFRRAFSLVELLIVIAILGILLAVASPYLSSNVPQ